MQLVQALLPIAMKKGSILSRNATAENVQIAEKMGLCKSYNGEKLPHPTLFFSEPVGEDNGRQII